MHRQLLGLAVLSLLAITACGLDRGQEVRAQADKDPYGYTGAYPKECLRPVDRSSEELLAFASGGTVSISQSGGLGTGSISNARLPIGWSADGRLLIIGQRGRVYDYQGDYYKPIQHRELVYGGQKMLWGWSPISRCVLDIKGFKYGGPLGVTAFDPSNAGKRSEAYLIKAGVRDFAFSSDGLSLAVAIEGAHGSISIQVIDLVMNKMRAILQLPYRTCCITFAGWNQGDSEVLYWARPGSFVAGAGWRLESVGLHGSRHSYAPSMVPDPARVMRCGGRLWGIVGEPTSSVGPVSRGYLKILRRDKKPLAVDTGGDSDLLPVCDSTGKRFAVGVTHRRGANAWTEIQIWDGMKRTSRLRLRAAPRDLDWGPGGDLMFLMPDRERCRFWIYEVGRDASRQEGSVPCRSLQVAQSWDQTLTRPSGLPVKRPVNSNPMGPFGRF